MAEPNVLENIQELEGQDIEALLNQVGGEDDFLASLEPGTEETTETTVEPAVADTKAEDGVKPAEKAPTSDLDAEEAKSAVQLFKALKDPALAPHILAYLNSQNVDRTVEKPKEETYNPLIEIRAAFPEGYENIADQLAPALVKVVDKLVEDRVAPVRAKTNEITYQENAARVQDSYDKFAKEHLGVDKVPQNYDNEIAGLAKQFPWSGEGTIETYTQNLLFMAKGKLGVPEGAKKADSTAVKKQASPLQKIANAPKPSGDSSIGSSKPARLSITQAFDAALGRQK